MACASELSAAGCRVTLCDRGRYAGGCSHGNCGYICPSHVLPHAGPGALRTTLAALLRRDSPLKVRPGTLLRNAGWFLRFARRCNRADQLHAAEGIRALLDSSRLLFDMLFSSEQMQVERDNNGLLFVFLSRAAFEHYRDVDELLSVNFGQRAERWDRERLIAEEPALKPESVNGGYRYPNDFQIRPDTLMSEWLRVLQKRGVVLREQCELTGWCGEKALTNQGVIEADAYVIATGAWTPLLHQLLGTRVPIIPGKGYSITMPRPAICPRFPMIFEEHRVAISPFASGYRIGSTMEFAGHDASLNVSRIRLLREGASYYLKEPWAEPVREQWWGWRPMVYDGKPIIDFLPGRDNVMLAAGHGMLGLSMATATGRLVRERLLGQQAHIDPTHYLLTRFR